MTPELDSPEAAAANEARHRLFWVGLICTLLGCQVVLMVVTAIIATRDNSFAVEPDYYEKSLNWDAIAAQRREDQRLGWQIALAVGAQASVLGERSVTATLTDRDGRPLDGASIELVAFPHARGNDRESAVLAPQGDGRYETTLRIKRRGLWEFRLAVKRGPDIFTSTQQQFVAQPRAGT
jgi:nitrogen fixation protein FixH